MPTPHCAMLAGVPENDEAACEQASRCVQGCEQSTCCVTTAGGEKYEQCLAQLRKRLGGEPEPGDVCGSCGSNW